MGSDEPNGWSKDTKSGFSRDIGAEPAASPSP
jgi:hypothetical protein